MAFRVRGFQNLSGFKLTGSTFAVQSHKSTYFAMFGILGHRIAAGDVGLGLTVYTVAFRVSDGIRVSVLVLVANQGLTPWSFEV